MTYAHIQQQKCQERLNPTSHSKMGRKLCQRQNGRTYACVFVLGQRCCILCSFFVLTQESGKTTLRRHSLYLKCWQSVKTKTEVKKTESIKLQKLKGNSKPTLNQPQTNHVQRVWNLFHALDIEAEDVVHWPTMIHHCRCSFEYAAQWGWMPQGLFFGGGIV